METLIMLQPLILVQRLSIHDADAVNLKWQKEWDKRREIDSDASAMHPHSKLHFPVL